MATKKFVQSFGALKELTDVRDYKLSVKIEKDYDFPEHFEYHMRSVKNQGQVGSCVAHALAEVAEFYNWAQDGIEEKLSVGFIYGNRRNSLSKSSGMYIREALSNLRKHGDVFYNDFKENKEVPEIISLFESRFADLEEKAYPNRITKYFRISTDEEIKYTLMNYGPVVFAMTWYSDIIVNDQGVITTKQDPTKSRGGHCMVIYGWNEDGWLIMNSWGTGWGKKGCAVLPYDIKKREVWGVSDEVSGDARNDVKKPKIPNWLAKIINWICNLFKKKGE